MPVQHFFVLTAAKPGRKEEFDRWYDDQHLVDVLAVPGVVKASRFRIVNQQEAVDSGVEWYSAAVYEIDADDPQQVIAEINARSGTATMPLSDSIELGAVMQLLSEPMRSVG